MEGIKIEVTGNIARIVQKPQTITSGTVGMTAEFTFDSAWDGLGKKAVFRACKEMRTVPVFDEEVIVPWEVLKEPNVWLSVGVYGTNTDGSLAIPTVWANVCVVRAGATDEGGPSADPTPPLLDQLIAEIEKLESLLGGEGGFGGDETVINRFLEQVVKNENVINNFVEEIAKNETVINSFIEEILKDDSVVNNFVEELVKDESVLNKFVEEFIRNDSVVNNFVEELFKDESVVNNFVEELVKDERVINNFVEEVSRNESVINRFVEEIVKDESISNKFVQEIVKNESVVNQFVEAVLKDESVINKFVEETIKNETVINRFVEEVAKNETVINSVLEEILKKEDIGQQIAEALPKVEAIDFSNFENGSFTETVDGKPITHYVDLDDLGRPTQIDGIFISWEAIG